MTTEKATKKKPLWLLIEEEFLALEPQDISGGSPEETIQRIAGNLDGKGYNVSKHGGHMVQLRFAAEDMRKVGRPLMKDFNDAIGAFTLDDVMDAYAATDKLITGVGTTWPKLKQAECRTVVIDFVEQRKLDLLIDKAKGMSGDEGIELLRHDAAHVMAEAVKELYPETQVTIGPAIEDGFYYDFSRAEPFTPEDLERIEQRMREIVARDESITREVWDRDEAVEFFRDAGEAYKAEIIASIPAGEPITLYRQGDVNFLVNEEPDSFASRFVEAAKARDELRGQVAAIARSNAMHLADRGRGDRFEIELFEAVFPALAELAAHHPPQLGVRHGVGRIAQDGQRLGVGHVPAQVVLEFLDRLVAVLDLLAQRLENDLLELSCTDAGRVETANDGTHARPGNVIDRNAHFVQYLDDANMSRTARPPVGPGVAAAASPGGTSRPPTPSSTVSRAPSISRAACWPSSAGSARSCVSMAAAPGCARRHRDAPRSRCP